MSLRAVITHTPTPPISAPPWLPDNLCYETLMGSVAYAVSNDTSDADVYGICLPPKDLVFPHLAGEIPGFGRQLKRFETWQQHHIRALGKQWDFQVYSIVTFFRLAMENNPNIIDALFTPRRCVLSSTAVGEYIREHRHDFLHRGAWHKFKGYAYAQLHKIKTKQQDPDSTRVWITDADGVAYDAKFAFHVIRLLLEVEMILGERSLDLERHAAQLRSVRTGEWTLARILAWAEDKERVLEAAYAASTLPYAPDEALIKRHLLHCLEAHYGSLDAAVQLPGAEVDLLRQIAMLTQRYAR